MTRSTHLTVVCITRSGISLDESERFSTGMTSQVVAVVVCASGTLETAAQGDVDALVLAGAVGGGREDEVDILVVLAVELDRVTTVLVQTAGVVDGYGLAAAVLAGIVVAELGIGCGGDGADQGAEEIEGLHVVNVDEDYRT